MGTAFARLVFDASVALVPDIDINPAQVLMSTALPDRLEIMMPLLASVRSERHSTFHPWEAGISINNRQRLAGELNDGRCVLSLAKGGHILRTVLLVVLRISDPWNRILTRLAKTEDGKFAPAVGLPGTKVKEGEIASQATRRLIKDDLPQFKDHLVPAVDTEDMEVTTSKGYGIQTMYLKTIFSATVDEDSARFFERVDSPFSRLDSWDLCDSEERPAAIHVYDAQGQHQVYAWLPEE